ncbi:MAG: GNAT family N-acetyltransferase [Candidatus Babeliales bacterium]
MSIDIHPFFPSDLSPLQKLFIALNKSQSTLDSYLEEHQQEKRELLVAYKNNILAGYLTITWHSLYPFFNNNSIPEIMDFNVLPEFRKQGIGSNLLAAAEQLVQEKGFDTVGIGVGLYADYGPAQKLYVKKGYIPDGNGVTYRYKYSTPGSSVCLDDDLILWFTKKLL